MSYSEKSSIFSDSEKPTYAQATQPNAVPTMSTNIDNRNVLNLPKNEEGKRQWSYGLLDCFNSPRFFFLSLAPCVLYSMNNSRLDYIERHGKPHPDGGDRFGGTCLAYSGLSSLMLGWALQVGTRGSIRNHYDIEGNSYDDYFTSLFCHGCALVQEARELEQEERFLAESA